MWDRGTSTGSEQKQTNFIGVAIQIKEMESLIVVKSGVLLFLDNTF